MLSKEDLKKSKGNKKEGNKWKTEEEEEEEEEEEQQQQQQQQGWVRKI